MGNGKSRMVSAPCSCMSLKNEEELKGRINKPNNKPSASNSSDGDDFNSKLVELFSKEKSKTIANKTRDLDYLTTKREKPKMRAPGAKSCECKYSLQPLTPSEQLDEVEVVFKEKESEKAGEKSAKRRRDSEKSDGKTCYECARAIRRMEKRNGLQKLTEPKKKCQCCWCKRQMNQLSEAQAIADAIQEYCARERKRAIELIRKERKGQKMHRCCMCNAKIDGKRAEPVSDEETDEDWDLEVDMEYGCCCSQFKEYPKQNDNCSKCAATTRGSIKQAEEFEDTDEAEVDITANEKEAVNENIASKGLEEDTTESFEEDRQQAQKHARGCTCCDCKKQQKTASRTSMNEALISVDDIELEALPENQAHRATRRSKTSLQAQAQRQNNSVRTQQTVSEVQEMEVEVLHEKEVFMKKTNMSEASGDEESAYTLAAKERRTRMSQDDKSEDGPHVKGCRCCQCKKASETRSQTAVYIPEERSPNRRLTASINQETKYLPRGSSAENRSQRRSTSTSRKESIETEQEYQTKTERNRPSIIEADKPLAKSRNSQRAKRYSSNKEDEGSLSIERHSKRCTCCECKKRRESTEYDYKGAYDEDEKVAEIEVEVKDAKEKEKEKKSCCCFTRKRTSKETSDGYLETTAREKEKETRSTGCCSCGKRKDSTKHTRCSSEHSRGSSRSQSRNEKQCQTECTCKKRKRVPLTKSCLCTRGNDEEALSVTAKRQREEDKQRQKLAEELANRIQRRAALQTELQKRLQDQQQAKQKQRCCCCYSEPSPQQPCCCYTPITCCEQSYGAPQPQPCSFQTKPCYFPSSPALAPTMFCEPPTCCCEPQTGYSRECPCCCQTMPLCYTATCSYTKPDRMSASKPH